MNAPPVITSDKVTFKHIHEWHQLELCARERSGPSAIDKFSGGFEWWTWENSKILYTNFICIFFYQIIIFYFKSAKSDDRFSPWMTKYVHELAIWYGPWDFFAFLFELMGYLLGVKWEAPENLFDTWETTKWKKLPAACSWESNNSLCGSTHMPFFFFSFAHPSLGPFLSWDNYWWNLEVSVEAATSESRWTRQYLGSVVKDAPVA